MTTETSGTLGGGEMDAYRYCGALSQTLRQLLTEHSTDASRVTARRLLARYDEWAAGLGAMRADGPLCDHCLGRVEAVPSAVAGCRVWRHVVTHAYGCGDPRNHAQVNGTTKAPREET